MPEHEHTEALNPATGESLGQIPLNRVEDIKTAVPRIRAAQISWAQKSFSERGTYLRKMEHHLVEHGEKYARIISQDNGKTLADAYMTDISSSVLAFDYYIKHSARVLRERRIKAPIFLVCSPATASSMSPWAWSGSSHPGIIPWPSPSMKSSWGSWRAMGSCSRLLLRPKWWARSSRRFWMPEICPRTCSFRLMSLVGWLVMPF